MTGSDRGSGSDSNVFLTLMGANGISSEEVGLERSQNTNKFESGATDNFDLNFKTHIEDVVAIKLRSDDSGMGSDWQLNSVTIFDTHHDTEYFFNCKNSWFKKDSKQQEFRSATKTKLHTYKICVSTSSSVNSGTDSNISITI